MSYMKPFSAELHSKHDVPAREKLIQILEGTPYEIRENPNKYDTDLQVFLNGKYYCGIEVEVKDVWRGPEFPFPDIQFLGRKRKQANKNMVFVLFNSDLSCHLAIRGDRLLEKGSNRKLANKFSNGNEEDFFAVSKDDVYFNYFTMLAKRTKKC
jgi:hypothetical protein